MTSPTPAKAAQLIGTGTLLVLFGCGNFVLLYMIHGEKYDFGDTEIFNRNSAFWTSVPVVAVGLLGVLAGITKRKLWVFLYIAGSTAATVLAILVAIVIGIKVTNIRLACGEDSDCRNSDTAVVMGTVILLASILVTIAMWGGVKACQSMWGPSKKVPRLRVVGEFKNGSSTSPTVVFHSESQVHPSGEETTTLRPDPSTSTCSSPHVVLMSAPREDGAEGNDTGYETINQTTRPTRDEMELDTPGYEVMNTIQDHNCENSQPENTFTANSQDEIPMDIATGEDSPKLVEAQREQNLADCDKCIYENEAYESNELTTAL